MQKTPSGVAYTVQSRPEEKSHGIAQRDSTFRQRRPVGLVDMYRLRILFVGCTQRHFDSLGSLITHLHVRCPRLVRWHRAVAPYIFLEEIVTDGIQRLEPNLLTDSVHDQQRLGFPAWCSRRVWGRDG